VNPTVTHPVKPSDSKLPDNNLGTKEFMRMNLHRTMFYFAQVNYNGRNVECEFCVEDGSVGSCGDMNILAAAFTIGDVGLGLGIPFVVIGAVFGLVWLVKAVIQPTKGSGGKPTPKA